jgi:hypothetical protein
MKTSTALAFLSLFVAAPCLSPAPAHADEAPQGVFFLKTAFRGQCLDFVNAGPDKNAAKLANCGPYTGMRWHATPVAGGWFSLSNENLGPGMCLDIVNGGQFNNYAEMRPCGGFSGQHWRLTPNGQGIWRLTTSFRGESMCLDIVNGGPNDGRAHLNPCGNFSGQAWAASAR